MANLNSLQNDHIFQVNVFPFNLRGRNIYKIKQTIYTFTSYRNILIQRFRQKEEKREKLPELNTTPTAACEHEEEERPCRVGRTVQHAWECITIYTNNVAF